MSEDAENHNHSQISGGSERYWSAPPWRVRVEDGNRVNWIDLKRPYVLIGSHRCCTLRIRGAHVPEVAYFVCCLRDRIEAWPTSAIAFARWGAIGPDVQVVVGPCSLTFHRLQPLGNARSSNTYLANSEIETRLSWPGQDFTKTFRRPVTIIGDNHPSVLRLHGRGLIDCNYAAVVQDNSFWLVDLSAKRMQRGERVRRLQAPGDRSQVGDAAIEFLAAKPRQEQNDDDDDDDDNDIGIGIGTEDPSTDIHSDIHSDEDSGGMSAMASGIYSYGSDSSSSFISSSTAPSEPPSESAGESVLGIDSHSEGDGDDAGASRHDPELCLTETTRRRLVAGDDDDDAEPGDEFDRRHQMEDDPIETTDLEDSVTRRVDGGTNRTPRPSRSEPCGERTVEAEESSSDAALHLVDTAMDLVDAAVKESESGLESGAAAHGESDREQELPSDDSTADLALSEEDPPTLLHLPPQSTDPPEQAASIESEERIDGEEYIEERAIDASEDTVDSLEVDEPFELPVTASDGVALSPEPASIDEGEPDLENPLISGSEEHPTGGISPSSEIEEIKESGIDPTIASDETLAPMTSSSHEPASETPSDLPQLEHNIGRESEADEASMIVQDQLFSNFDEQSLFDSSVTSSWPEQDAQNRDAQNLDAQNLEDLEQGDLEFGTRHHEVPHQEAPHHEVPHQETLPQETLHAATGESVSDAEATATEESNEFDQAASSSLDLERSADEESAGERTAFPSEANLTDSQEASLRAAEEEDEETPVADESWDSQWEQDGFVEASEKQGEAPHETSSLNEANDSGILLAEDSDARESDADSDEDAVSMAAPDIALSEPSEVSSESEPQAFDHHAIDHHECSDEADAWSLPTESESDSDFDDDAVPPSPATSADLPTQAQRAIDAEALTSQVTMRLTEIGKVPTMPQQILRWVAVTVGIIVPLTVLIWVVQRIYSEWY